MEPETQDRKANKCADTSCACDNKKANSSLNLKEEITTKNKEDDKALDPTHFGDWQVNCRAIDF
ncbi:MAG: hypothetical protein KGQ36_02750 [Rickettsiales bacterium]|nr:hypothetical protein [Rickettsiales bacterium]